MPRPPADQPRRPTTSGKSGGCLPCQPGTPIFCAASCRLTRAATQPLPSIPSAKGKPGHAHMQRGNPSCHILWPRKKKITRRILKTPLSRWMALTRLTPPCRCQCSNIPAVSLYSEKASTVTAVGPLVGGRICSPSARSYRTPGPVSTVWDQPAGVPRPGTNSAEKASVIFPLYSPSREASHRIAKVGQWTETGTKTTQTDLRCISNDACVALPTNLEGRSDPDSGHSAISDDPASGSGIPDPRRKTRPRTKHCIGDCILDALRTFRWR